MTAPSFRTPPQGAGLSRSLCLALITLVALFSFGCGDSNDSYVFTNTNGNTAQTGSLTFNFIAPQAQAVQAPAGTTSVRFDLHAGPNGTGAIVSTTTRPFATTITIDNVPPTVQSVVVTFITANGVPTQTLVGNVTVALGANTVVNLSGFTTDVPTFTGLTVTPAAVSLNVGETQALTVTANFDNGFAVDLSGAGKGVTYTPDNSDHATVSASGVITGTNPGVAQVAVSITANGTPITVAVPVTVTSTANGTFSITPAAVSEAPGETTTAALFASFTPTGGTASNVIADVDFVSSDDTVATVDSTGRVVIDASAQIGDTATLTGTYTDGDGNVFTDLVSVTVAADQVAAITVAPATVTLPSGGFRYDLVVTGVDLNSDPIDVNLDQFSSTSSNSTVATVTGGRITTGGVGTSTVTVTSNGNASISGQVVVTTVDATVTGLTVPQNSFSLYISQSAPIQVTAQLSNGATLQNAQNSPDLQVTDGSIYATVVNGSLVALDTTSDLPFTSQSISIGFPNGPSVDRPLTVREVQLTSVQVRVGGMTSPDNTFNIPLAHNALVEVIGNFEDGSSRPLQSGENYDLVFGNGGTTIVANDGSDIGITSAFISTDGSGVGEAADLDIVLQDIIKGDVANPVINPTVVDGTPTSLTVAFANYSDDHRLLTDGTTDKFDRALDVRANFAGVTGFRVSSLDSLFISDAGNLDVNGPDRSFEGWPTIASNTVSSAADDVEFSYDSVTAALADVTILIPNRQTTSPNGTGSNNTVVAEVGTSLTFRTLIDYGDGILTNRTLDYPVFSEYFDFVRDFQGTIDLANGTTSFFFKKTTDQNGSPFVFRALDAEGDTLPPIGTSSATQILVDVVSNL